MVIEGPKLGYIPNSSKCWIVAHHQEQIHVFQSSSITAEMNETLRGTRYLGGAIGTDEFKLEYYESKLNAINQKMFVPNL